MVLLIDVFVVDEFRQQFEVCGICCVLECCIVVIDVDGVWLVDGCVFCVVRVVLVIGVQFDSCLVVQFGVLCQWGIVVDCQMVFLLLGISVIGECCEIDGQIWGLVVFCLCQVEVLVDCLCGVFGEGFVWQDVGICLKVIGIEFFSVGEQQVGEQDDIYISWDFIDCYYCCLLLCDGCLCGVLLMGDCIVVVVFIVCLESDEFVIVDWFFDFFLMQLQVVGIMMMMKFVLVLVGYGMVGYYFFE